MQANLNCNCPKPQQSFGMAICSNENVSKVFAKRIKTAADAEKLNAIFEKQKANKKVDIVLFANQNDTLDANIFSRDDNNYFLKSFSESRLSKLFRSPVKFIEKLARVADKEAIKLRKKEEIANKLKFNN